MIMIYALNLMMLVVCPLEMHVCVCKIYNKLLNGYYGMAARGAATS